MSFCIQVCFSPGITLRLDFPFSAFPDNLGYWAEVLLPLYSTLRHSFWKELIPGDHQHISRILLGNVPKHMLDWPEKVLAIAVAPAFDAATAVAGGPEGLPLLVEEKSLHEWCRYATTKNGLSSRKVDFPFHPKSIL